jgi:two-component system, cell cycle sensor histidine kinase and response regulator CckA
MPATIEPGSATPRDAKGEPTSVLAASDELFRTVFESATIAVKVVELETFHVIAANASFQRLLGYSLDELASRSYIEYTHVDDRSAEQAAYEDALSGRADTFLIVKRYLRSDGTAVWVRKTGSLVRDESGRPVYEISMAEDVSREREAERARRDADERYRQIVETTIEGIWVIDADNRTTFVNDPMARMLATSVAEMQGRPISEFCDAEELRKAEQSIDRRRGGRSERFEMKLRRSDGTEMNGWLSANPVFDASGSYTGSVAMVSDVTERVQQAKRRLELEEELRQSQRLEAIGRLAGGVAHDFNNLLFAIRGFGELALGRLERGEDNAGSDIKEMLAATDRAVRLTHQLLAFGRRQVLQPEVVDLREIAADMEKLLCQLIGEQVKLVITSPDLPVLVEVDRTQLEQVITNLAVNARDAMPGGGRLQIDVSCSGDECAEAVLAVTDNGCGMDAETAACIFEPFFSTKEGSGSGLGLATVHGIVSQSRGRIALDSRPGHGSTFSIFLPLSKGTPAPQAVEPVEADGGAETILLVEDEVVVRTIAARMLEDIGYSVVAAGGGDAALALAAKCSKIDLILTDLAMPGLSGRETAARVRDLFPAAKVLYMSGYTDDVAIRGGSSEPGTAFIQKPFGADQLARSLRDVLEMKPA